MRTRSVRCRLLRALATASLLPALTTICGAQPASSTPPAPRAQNAPVEPAHALAVAGRWIGGDAGAAAELTRLGPAVVPIVRGLLVESGKERLLAELVGALARAELERSIREESSLIYYGQFDSLTVLGEEAGLAMLAILTDEDAVRELRTRASIALGDLRGVMTEPTLQRLQGELRALARDFLTEPWCAVEASYLLARLGDRSLVQSQIESNLAIVGQPPTPANLPEIIGAHTDLAEVYYRIQDYASAIKHYQLKRVILMDLSQRAREELRAGIAQEVALLDYNLACSQSLDGRIDACYETLERSLVHPTITLDMVQNDGDLRPLRADGRFAAWRERMRALVRPPAAEPR
ncbi:MAG: hypothetical protein AB7O52_06495 [Planctomycetota bacterium]